MNDAVQIALGVGLFLASALLVWLIVLLSGAVKKLNNLVVQVDHALVPFGQSGLGQLVHQAAQQGRTYVDQPTDPLVVQAVSLLNSLTFVAQLAKAAGIQVTPDRVAVWGRAIFDALAGLTDGVPVGEPPTDEAIP